MSDQDLIAPRSIDDEDLLFDDEDGDGGDSDSDGDGDDAIDPVDSSLPSMVPLQALQPQRKLSTFLTECDKQVEGTSAKKFMLKIKEVRVPNPKVYQFKAGDKPNNIIKEQTGNLKPKELRAKWQDLRHAYTATAFHHDGKQFLGYVTSGKDEKLAHLPVTDRSRFVRFPPQFLAMLHSPDFDPAKYYNVTQQDQRLVNLVTEKGIRFQSVNFDPRFILRHAKLAESSSRKASSGGAKKPAATGQSRSATKKVDSDNDLGASVCAAALTHLLTLQRAPHLSDVSVVLAQSPHYKTLQALFGADRFPLLRSEETDGLSMVPGDLGGDLRRAMECFLKLVVVGTDMDAPTTTTTPGQWSTETIMRALLVLQMAPQFATSAGVNFLRSRGMALSEKNIASVMKEFESSDESHAMIAHALAQLVTAQLIFDELVRVDHPVLKTAAPLIAFASSALRLGELREECFHPSATPNPPVLRCSLTGMAIVPGMSFYMLCAKSRPTATQSAGQAMIAIVAKSVDESYMPLHSTVTKPAATVAAPKAKKAAATEKTPEQIKEAREKKNERAREIRRLKKEKEGAAGDRAASLSPPQTPVPSPRKLKRQVSAPSDEASAKNKKKKQSHVAAVAGPYLGVAPVLEAAGLAFDGSPLFQALANFATVDPTVGQALSVFLARAPKSYDPDATPEAAFKEWSAANQAIFLQLLPVFNFFVKKQSALSEEQRQCLVDATSGAAASENVDNGEENSDAMVIDEMMDDEMRAAMADAGFALPEKKETKPPPAFAVQAAPVQEDPIFAPFVTMAAKLPSRPSKFLTAIEAAGAKPLTLPHLLALMKETTTSGPTDEGALKKMLGNTLAAFKWLFPSASK